MTAGESTKAHEAMRACYADVVVDIERFLGADAPAGGVVDLPEDCSADLYTSEQLGSLPTGAGAAARGCANPIEHAGLQPGEVVVDLGSGGGVDALLAARLVGPTGFVYGIDITPEMVALAERIRDSIGAENVRFLHGDVEALPLPDGSVDVIISNGAVSLAPDTEAVFSEAHRVLRADGRMVIADTISLGTIPESVVGKLGGPVGVLSDDRFVALLASAGFTDTSVDVLRTFGMRDLGVTDTTMLSDLGWGDVSETDLEQADGRVAHAVVRTRKAMARQGTGRLAVEGGRPVRERPIRARATLTAADIAAAQSVMESGDLGGPDHPEVQRFESALAEASGVPDAVAINSGTAAIHCVLLGMGVGPGDEVIVPAHTFIASATPILMTGATPVVVDVDDATYCIDPAAAADAVTNRTKAIVAVHINGHPAPVDLLPAGIPVISDACQAHGAALGETPVGAMGVASTFSFWQDKLITAGGEGGAVLTADADLAHAVRVLRSHAQEPIPGTSNSHHVALGYNYRLTAVQAAVGRSQLARLPGILDLRRQIAQRLMEALVDVRGIAPPVTREGARHVFWKFVVAIEPERFRGGLDAIVRAIRAEGVDAAPRYPIPLHQQPVIMERARLTPCPVAESLSRRLLMLPLPAGREDADDVEDVAAAARKVVAALHR